MDSSVSPKDEIWFLRMCHHISNSVYYRRSRAYNGTGIFHYSQGKFRCIFRDINFSKTEEIRVNTTVKQRLRLNGEDIKRSSDFCYLGSIFAEDGGTSKEVNVRIQKARGSFSKLRSVWPSKSLQKKALK